jgi:predicted transcriptional regulator
MTDQKLLNKNEEAVMELLWEMKKPVTITEMEKKLRKKKITKATIFKTIQSLTEKNYICVNGLEKAGKAYARCFESSITREEYAALLLESKGISEASICDVVVAMLGNGKEGGHDSERDQMFIDEMKALIEKLRGGMME